MKTKNYHNNSKINLTKVGTTNSKEFFFHFCSKCKDGRKIVHHEVETLKKTKKMEDSIFTMILNGVYRI